MYQIILEAQRKYFFFTFIIKILFYVHVQCTWKCMYLEKQYYFTGFPLKGMMYNMWVIIYRMIYMANSMFQG